MWKAPFTAQQTDLLSPAIAGQSDGGHGGAWRAAATATAATALSRAVVAEDLSLVPFLPHRGGVRLANGAAWLQAQRHRKQSGKRTSLTCRDQQWEDGYATDTDAPPPNDTNMETEVPFLWRIWQQIKRSDRHPHCLFSQPIQRRCERSVSSSSSSYFLFDIGSSSVVWHSLVQRPDWTGWECAELHLCITLYIQKHTI